MTYQDEIGGKEYIVENINHNEFKVGDLSLEHGCVFKLTERKDFPCEYSPDGIVSCFKTECLFFSGSMPKHWADTWSSQGNANARSRRLVEKQVA